VYGAASPGLQGDGRPVTTVGAAAALYVAELRAIQPAGPYRVGGYCSGAMIALEMAQQLRAAGERVLPLVLFEPSTEPYELDEGARSIGLTDRRRELYQLLAERAVDPAQPDVGPLLARLGLPADVGQGPLGRRMLTVMAANYEAWLDYEPRPYEGDIVLFLATEPPGGHESRGRRWAGIGRGAITTHLFPGNHRTILHRSNMPEICRLMA
jgi:thioesterase domain-containing protein